MTSALSSDLMMSILAMDAYNHGYNAALKFENNLQIGSATFKTDSVIKLGVDDTRASGFYAVAYTWNGETIIFYRGTDNQSFFADPVKGASDVWSGWTIGAGYANASQATWAEKLYQAVTNQSVWADTAPSNVGLRPFFMSVDRRRRIRVGVQSVAARPRLKLRHRIFESRR